METIAKHTEHIDTSGMYTSSPKDKYELRLIIEVEVSIHGKSADLNHIDVSNICSLSEVFKCSEFDGDISRWNVSKAEYMDYMFSDVDSSMPIEKLSVWNPVKVEDIRGFYNMEDKSRVSFIKDVWQYKIENPESCIGLSTYTK